MSKKQLKESISKIKVKPSSKDRLSETLGLTREGYALIRLDQIDPNPDQPRRSFSNKKLNELSLSIKERGVIQPIRVRTVDDRYQIIVGERRWRASKVAGLEEIPSIIVNQEADQAYIDALIENVLREDLNPIDRADGLFNVRVNLGLQSWEELGERIGLSRQYIHNLLGLKKLPKNIQEDIRQGKLNEKHGRALKTLLDHKVLLEKAYKTIKGKKLSGDDALELAKSMRRKQLKTISPKVASVKKFSDSLTKKSFSVDFKKINEQERAILIDSMEKARIFATNILEQLQKKK